MYEVFDKFLDRETWYSKHSIDEQVFYVCLDKVISNEGFDPEVLGNYLRDKIRLSGNDDDVFNRAIDHYVKEAWAIKDFLKTNNYIRSE